ncbi:MAG: hypothetical protein ACYC3X_09630 [Pirellulaceae bacterium]
METLLQADNATFRREPAAAAVVFAVLVSLPALLCLVRGMADEPDVWWHIKTGEWIVDHHAWPEIDSFSSTGAGERWLAYSWLPELMLAGLYKTLGLRGLMMYTAVVSAGIVAALLVMLRRTGANMTVVVGLTLAGTVGLIPVETPRPWLFSILFCIIELDMLLAAGQTGDRWRLLWLVPLFAIWANMHIQFILGLAVLGAAVTESLLSRVLPQTWVDDDSRRTGPGWMLMIFALCVAATLINPYHYRLYLAAWELVTQSSQLRDIIQELRAMPFRSVADWTVLGVAVCAAFALGWRRRVRLLLLLLLIAGLWISFRSGRDAWFVLVVGLAGLASVAPKLTAAKQTAPRWLNWTIGSVAAGVVMLSGVFLSESKLEEKVASYFPAEAVRFVREHEFVGPMFNPFSWGGYLIYHLPEVPVSIDGRTMVYGDARVIRHVKTLRGAIGWQDDSELTVARLVLLPRDTVLAALLRVDGHYRLVHEDAVAVVFVVETEGYEKG